MRTIPEVILDAARGLAGPFTAEELLIAAWRQEPTLMGIPGHTEYPDMRKAQNVLYGRKGLVSSGMLRKIGERFEMGAGNGAGTTSPAAAADAPSLPLALVVAAGSKAARLFAVGRKEDIRFTNALAFWGWNSRQSVDMLTAQIDAIDRLLADRATAELRALGACQDWLRQHYKHNVALLQGRRLRTDGKQRGGGGVRPETSRPDYSRQVG